MLRKISIMLGMLLIMFCTVSHAQSFNFAYTFHTGDIVSGTLDGTQNGLYVEDISNVSVFFNNNPFPNSGMSLRGLYIDSYGVPTYRAGMPVHVSFNGDLNQFAFVNTLDPNYYGIMSFFRMDNRSNQYGSIHNATTAYQVSPTGALVLDDYDMSYPAFNYYYNNGYNSAKWSLTPVIAPPSSVPLPAAAPLMLSGLGLLGFSARRKRRTLN